MDATAQWARRLAERLLADELPRRWAHTQGVAAQARAVAERLGVDAAVVETAAWLHDIGYAPELAVTGFHPLDGARYLRDVEAADRLICELVAHHSGALAEAEERGLTRELIEEFGPGSEHPQLLDTLTACDMTTGPDGVPRAPEDRISEILTRYPPDHVVHRAVSRSGEDLIATTRRATTRG